MVDSDIIHYELQGGTCRDWWDDMIEKTAKYQIEEEMKLFDYLWQMHMRHGDEKRSLAALVNERDPNKTVQYVLDDEDWTMKRVPRVVDINPDGPKHYIPKSCTNFGQLVLEVFELRELASAETTAEKTAQSIEQGIKQAKSEFKRFTGKRRK